MKFFQLQLYIPGIFFFEERERNLRPSQRRRVAKSEASPSRSATRSIPRGRNKNKNSKYHSRKTTREELNEVKELIPKITNQVRSLL